jgi:hypothetical protein
MAIINHNGTFRPVKRFPARAVMKKDDDSAGNRRGLELNTEFQGAVCDRDEDLSIVDASATVVMKMRIVSYIPTSALFFTRMAFGVFLLKKPRSLRKMVKFLREMAFTALVRLSIVTTLVSFEKSVMPVLKKLVRRSLVPRMQCFVPPSGSSRTSRAYDYAF